MTKNELFKKYHIEERHNVWDLNIDNWMSVEIFRVMHDGRLPEETDRSLLYVLQFLDKKNTDVKWWVEKIMVRQDWGSLFLTAKRQVYLHSEILLSELNQQK